VVGRALAPLVLSALLTLPAGVAAQTQPPQPAAPVIEKGSTVKLEFTVRDEAGVLLATNRGEAPQTFVQGQQQIIPGLERELYGLKPGDEKRVVVKPEDGYGPVNPQAQAEVPKQALPPGTLRPGTPIMARTQSGEERPVSVKEVRENTVILDLNHPFAGKTLVFDVKVLAVEPPRPAGLPPGQ
jgi:FKBP-type peptidyl-prolyl cis-trans isomerase SlyD